MIFKIKNLYIDISYYFLIIIALILANDRFHLALYLFSSILLHEIGHLIFIFFYHVKINKISFKVYGISISINYSQYLSDYQDILILISGPLSNLFIALIFYLFNLNKIFIIINLSIAIFNMLPIESLDGGKILNIILFKFLPMKLAYNTSFIISIIFSAIVFIINFFSIIHGKFNLTFSIICVTLIFKIVSNLPIN